MASDSIKGHLDALLLAVLEAGPLHGYAVIEELQRRSNGVLQVPTGTIYPALRRLERTGWIAGEWSMVAGRRRRTYRLTRSGRKALAEERIQWERLAGMIATVLNGPAKAPARGAS